MESRYVLCRDESGYIVMLLTERRVIYAMEIEQCYFWLLTSNSRVSCYRHSIRVFVNLIYIVVS